MISFVTSFFYPDPVEQQRVRDSLDALQTGSVGEVLSNNYKWADHATNYAPFLTMEASAFIQELLRHRGSVLPTDLPAVARVYEHVKDSALPLSSSQKSFLAQLCFNLIGKGTFRTRLIDKCMQKFLSMEPEEVEEDPLTSEKVRVAATSFIYSMTKECTEPLTKEVEDEISSAVDAFLAIFQMQQGYDDVLEAVPCFMEGIVTNDSYEVRIEILRFLTQRQREDGFFALLSIFTKGVPDGSQRVKILTTLHNLLEDHQSAYTLKTMVHFLVRMKIPEERLNAFIAILSFVERIEEFDAREEILKAIASLLKKRMAAVIERALPFIKEVRDAHQRVLILNLIEKLPENDLCTKDPQGLVRFIPDRALTGHSVGSILSAKIVAHRFMLRFLVQRIPGDLLAQIVEDIDLLASDTRMEALNILFRAYQAKTLTRSNILSTVLQEKPWIQEACPTYLLRKFSKDTPRGWVPLSLNELLFLPYEIQDGLRKLAMRVLDHRVELGLPPELGPLTEEQDSVATSLRLWHRELPHPLTQVAHVLDPRIYGDEY